LDFPLLRCQSPRNFRVTVPLEINLASWASNIQSPGMLVNRVLLVQIDLEELVVRSELKILVSMFGKLSIYLDIGQILMALTN
jgi:hypothetical protein